MLNGTISFKGVKMKAGSLFRFVYDVFGAYLLDSNFRLVLYAASDHSIHSNCTETHLICKTWITDLICYLCSHKKQDSYDQGKIHFVLKFCISQICSY